MTRPHPTGTAQIRSRTRHALASRLRRPWLALKRHRIRRRLAGPRLLRAFARAYPDAFFIEIGANDGDQHDQLQPLIRSGGWRGLMVEPVPYVFERLRRNYAALERIRLENAAIADRDGTVPFYHLAQVEAPERERLPSWYDGTGSLSREAVMAHANHIPDVDRRIVRTEVPCLTFETLCRKHGVRELDLVLIDTEGYDERIVRQVDFTTRRPRLLIYEHYHLEPGDRVACRRRVEQAGYLTLEEGFDTFCLDPTPDDSLLRVWHRLRPGVPGVSIHEAAE